MGTVWDNGSLTAGEVLIEVAILLLLSAVVLPGRLASRPEAPPRTLLSATGSASALIWPGSAVTSDLSTAFPEAFSFDPASLYGGGWLSAPVAHGLDTLEP